MEVQLLMLVKPNMYFKLFYFFHLCRTEGLAGYQINGISTTQVDLWFPLERQGLWTEVPF